MKTINKNCEHCGNEFPASRREHKRGNAKYCSLSCSAKNQRKYSPLKDCKCENCGKDFTSKTSAKYCSRKCKYQTYRKKQKIQKLSIKTIYKLLSHLPCEICGWNSTRRDVHHIIPVSKGGTNKLTNLLVVCPNHHRMIHKNLVSEETIEMALKSRLSLHPEINQEQDTISGN